MIVPLARKSVIAGILTINPPSIESSVLGGFSFAREAIYTEDQGVAVGIGTFPIFSRKHLQTLDEPISSN
jgi:hypothetical protein